MNIILDCLFHHSRIYKHGYVYDKYEKKVDESLQIGTNTGGLKLFIDRDLETSLNLETDFAWS